MSTPLSLALVGQLVSALAGALPVPAPLRVGEPVPVTGVAAALPAEAGTAVLATVGAGPGSNVTGEIAVVVAGDLVEALRQSPLGALDVAAAVAPALSAAANAIGSTCGQARELAAELALDTLLAQPGVQVLPLHGPDGGVVATAVVALSGAAAAAPLPSFPAQGGAIGSPARGGEPVRRHGLELLRDVEMEVTVELGRTRMTVRDLLSLAPGAVVELDRMAGSPADLLVNGTLIARGEVVVVDEDFGIRITEIVGPTAAADGEAPGGSAA